MNGIAQKCDIFLEFKSENSDYIPNVDITYLSKVNQGNELHKKSNYEFQLSIYDTSPLLIMASALGFRDTIISISCINNEKNKIQYYLKPLEVVFDEIEITHKKNPYAIHGDSITFELKLFESGNEQSGFDIISKIPGISFGERKISYKGKAMENVLIAGRNLAGEDQIKHIENINFQSISHVTVIKKYDDNFTFSIDSNNFNLVFEIKLKDEYFGSFQATSDLKTGHNRVFYFGLNGTKINRNYGLNFSFLGNNNEHQFSLSNIENEILNQSLFKTISPLILKNINQENEGQKNFANRKQIAGKTTLDIDLFKSKVKLNSQNNVVLLNGKNVLANRTKYTFNQIIWDNNISDQLSGFYLSNLTKIVFPFFKKSRFEVQFPFDYNFSRGKKEVLGTISRNQYKNKNNYKNYNYYLNPVYKNLLFINEDTKLSIFGEFGLFDKSFDNSFESSNKNGPLLLVNNSSLYATSQIGEITNKYSSLNLLLLKKLNNFTLELDYNNVFSQEDIIYKKEDEPILPYHGNERLKFNANNFNFKTGFQKMKFKIFAGYKYGVSHTIFQLEKNKIIQGIPFFMTSLPISKNWYSVASFDYTLNQVSLGYLTNLSYIQDQVSSSRGNSELNLLYSKPAITITLNKRPKLIGNELFISSAFTYFPQYNELVYQYNPLVQLNERKAAFVEKTNQLQYKVLISKNHENLFSRIEALYGTNEASYLDQRYKDKILSLNLNSQFKAENQSSYSLEFTMIHNTRIFEFSKIRNLFATSKFSLKYPYNKIIFLASYLGQYNFNQQDHNLYHRINFNITRKKVFEKFEVSLSGYDILNLNSSKIVTTVYSPERIATFESFNFPGNLMVGIKYYFLQKI